EQQQAVSDLAHALALQNNWDANNLPVYGHGELTGHKDATEGVSLAQAVRGGDITTSQIANLPGPIAPAQQALRDNQQLQQGTAPAPEYNPGAFGILQQIPAAEPFSSAPANPVSDVPAWAEPARTPMFSSGQAYDDPYAAAMNGLDPYQGFQAGNIQY